MESQYRHLWSYMARSLHFSIVSALSEFQLGRPSERRENGWNIFCDNNKNNKMNMKKDDENFRPINSVGISHALQAPIAFIKVRVPTTKYWFQRYYFCTSSRLAYLKGISSLTFSLYSALFLVLRSFLDHMRVRTVNCDVITINLYNKQPFEHEISLWVL